MLSCLDLIKFKSLCKAGETGLFVEQFVDINTVMLAHLADESELTGKKYGAELIQAAIAELSADIMLANSNGYSINNIVYQYNNTCRFTETLSNFGITLTSYFRSTSGKLYVPSVQFKPELSGEFILIVDDGYELKEFQVTGTAGEINTAMIEYSTTAKQVKIYAKDATLKFNMLSCQSGGCGSCAAKRGVQLQLQGYNRSGVTQQASGFIPTAYIACDMDAVICNVITRYKDLFAKALAYKVGIMAYMRLLISPRLNDTTLNINEDNAKLYLNTLESKYRELIFGSAQAYGNAATTGIIKIIQQSWKTTNDGCVTCNSTITKSTAVF
jgi:hypothetical protein